LAEETEELEVPKFELPAGLLTSLYFKLTVIQHKLTTKRELTHLDLFRFLEPVLALQYSEVTTTH
jgi:hypothetical protein